VGTTVAVGAPGAAYSMSVTATSPDGGALSYQWYSNETASNTGGTPIGGATNPSYAAPIDVIGVFYYYVVVTNTITDNGDGGTKTASLSSNVATVKVNEETGNLTITATAGTGGKITPSGVIKVYAGSAQAFQIVPDVGYKIEHVYVDEVDQPEAVKTGYYCFYSISTSHTIHATFVNLALTITATAGSGGKITPAGVITITQGKSQTFVIAANTGFKIENVFVDEAPVGAVSMYTFSNVQASHTINATFVSKTVAPPLAIEEQETGNIEVFSHNKTVTVMNEALIPVQQVEIMDMFGRIVWSGQAPDVRNEITLNVAAGIYLVRVLDIDCQFTIKKVIIN
jgi:hypothetical protein